MIIQRENYLKWLRASEGLKLIKVITGLRRVGKSTLLAQFRDDLCKRGVKKAQIQAFNFEERQADDFGDWHKLYDHIEHRLLPDRVNYIFLDEIQNVPEFERAVDALFVRENVDLYITGSNAYMLSGDLATRLSGRYLSLHVLPYSFGEYSQCFPERSDRDRLFQQYLDSSALPEVVSLTQKDPALADQYLRDLYQTVIKKDIALRYDIRNESMLDRTLRYVSSVIGSPVSPNGISNALKTDHANLHRDTVDRYLQYLRECYLLYSVGRYDLKGKRILMTNDKYYAVDLGLRRLLLGSAAVSDQGHRLENVVYLELLRRNHGVVYAGRDGDREVDFLVQKNDGRRTYYQVAYQVDGQPETLARELAPLQKIDDNYPKILLTNDLSTENINGIQKVNVVDWLLSGDED